MSLFDESGRLGFQWDYTTADNEMIIDLLFSQKDVSYYFYENQQALQFSTSTQNDNVNGQSGLYYDDGKGYINGYTAGFASGSGAGGAGGAAGGAGGAAGGAGGSGGAAGGSGGAAGGGMGDLFDQSALNGEYYGMG